MRHIKQRAAGLCLLTMLVVFLPLMGCEPTSGPPPYQTYEVTYAGVKDYGSVKAENKDSFTYRFYDGDTQLLFSMDNRVADPVTGQPYALQNKLRHGARYRILVKGGQVIELDEIAPESDAPVTGPVSAVPGEKTVKNLLATALLPVGRTLYIYGGGWNWQDDGASAEARSIGVASSWAAFFEEQTAHFNYRDKNPSISYYPYGKWNEYYYAGLDCSGYVGWMLYNVIHTEDGQPGYVMGANKMAKAFADYGWGTRTREELTPGDGQLRPGDIVSKPGHVWVCVGVCEDGSAVFAHASPTESYLGRGGGGVQLSALGDSTHCDAYRLAERYMKTYYPEWFSRYPVALKSFAEYGNFEGNDILGRFTWDTSGSGLLTDPEGIRDMSAEQVLALLFGETK